MELQFAVGDLLDLSGANASLADIEIVCKFPAPNAGMCAGKTPESHTFSAHRLVLAAGSGYFRRQILAAGRHGPNGIPQAPSTLHLRGIKPHIFKQVLGLLYTGTASLSSLRDACHFTHTAHFLELSVCHQIEERFLDEVPLIQPHHRRRSKVQRKQKSAPASLVRDHKSHSKATSAGDNHPEVVETSGDECEASYLHELWKRYAADPKCYDRSEPSSRLRPKIRAEPRSNGSNMWKCTQCTFSTANKAKMGRHVGRRHHITYKI